MPKLIVISTGAWIDPREVQSVGRGRHNPDGFDVDIVFRGNDTITYTYDTKDEADDLVDEVANLVNAAYEKVLD